MTVIGTVGLPGSGKGEAAAVAREEGVPVVTMGDVVRDACRERGLDPAEHHGAVARQLREEDGDDAIAARSLPTVREHLAEAEVVLVDGLRSGVEAERFEAAFDDEFVLVAVTAPFEVRAGRLGARGRDDSDLDRAALRDREERELGFGMDEAMAAADLTVENVGGLERYRETVRRLLRGGPAAVAGADGVSDGGVDPAAAGDTAAAADGTGPDR